MDSFESQLKEKLGAGLEEKLAEKQKKFAGLLTREGALKLIALEHGFSSSVSAKDSFSKLAELKDFQGDTFSVMAAVKQVFCASEFETEKKSGRVSRVSIADETGEATLVLWDKDSDFAERKLERNCVLAVKNASVKNGELQSSLFTEISHLDERKGLPDFSKPLSSLDKAKDGDDFHCRVAETGAVKEFERNGRKGKVLNLIVEDGAVKRTLVCWGRNAEIASRLKEGDVIKVESVVEKNGELQASWTTHLLAHAKNHSLREIEFKNFSSIAPGEQAFSVITLDKLFDARVSRKCVSCGLAIEKEVEKCSCGGAPREVFFISVEAEDSSGGRARLVFFGEQAVELLGMKKTVLDKELVFQLKRDFLQGREFKLKVLAKAGRDGAVEFVAKQIRS